MRGSGMRGPEASMRGRPGGQAEVRHAQTGQPAWHALLSHALLSPGAGTSVVSAGGRGS